MNPPVRSRARVRRSDFEDSGAGPLQTLITTPEAQKCAEDKRMLDTLDLVAHCYEGWGTSLYVIEAVH